MFSFKIYVSKMKNIILRNRCNLIENFAFVLGKFRIIHFQKSSPPRFQFRIFIYFSVYAHFIAKTSNATRKIFINKDETIPICIFITELSRKIRQIPKPITKRQTPPNFQNRNNNDK